MQTPEEEAAAVKAQEEEAAKAQENNDNDGGEPQLSEVQQLAQKIGWNPQHEDGDRKFKTAEEFILGSKEIQNTQNRQNKNLERKVGDLTKGMNLLQQHNDTVYKVQVKALKGRISELKGRRKDAVEDGDTEAVSAIDAQVKELNNIPEELPVEKIESVPVEFEEWVDQNEWYKTDNEMRAYADEIGKEYAGKSLPLTKVYEMVTKKVKSVFPENFKQEKKTPPAASVEGATQSDRKKTVKSKYTYNDLSRSQQDICKHLVKMGLKTEQEYIDELTEIEKNQGRV